MENEHVVLTEVRDGVAVITLNRPEAGNAFNAAVTDQLQKALVASDADPDVRCIVVTGAGRHFCVGLDLSAGGFGAGAELDEIGNGERLEPASALRTPVVAAINGHAVGVGITFAMTCDLRVVADDAKLGFVFVRRGIVPEFYAHWTVQRSVGLVKAAELFLTGATISGVEAADIGLVNRAVARDEVLDVALGMAREIATYASPAAAATTKRLLWDAATAEMAAVYGWESDSIRWLSGQPDAAEGVRSFFEKRVPDWTSTTNSEPPARTSP